MKEVFNNDEIAFGVLAGLTRAFKSTGTKDWISGLLVSSSANSDISHETCREP
jgi:hypothetical protein